MQYFILFANKSTLNSQNLMRLQPCIKFPSLIVVRKAIPEIIEV
jgi:hypothetical protein